MTPVKIQGREMSAEDAAKLIVRAVNTEVALRGGRPWDHLNKILDEWCDPATMFAVKDAVYQKVEGKRLN